MFVLCVMQVATIRVFHSLTHMRNFQSENQYFIKNKIIDGKLRVELTEEKKREINLNEMIQINP